MCFRFSSVLKKPASLNFCWSFKNILAFLVTLLSKFYWKKRFASSLLCCSIFTLVLVRTIQRVNLSSTSCCVILHDVSRNKNKINFFPPRPYFFVSCSRKYRNFLNSFKCGLCAGQWRRSRGTFASATKF